MALSGGGDSIALLQVAADWARGNGRRLLALTVDHGLNPDSADWTAFAEEAARDLGADWRGLTWTGAKPSVGLPAAARRARHGLIADAAREAGARVVLFAHTADDIAEGDLMRAEGSTLGRLRDWAPSPAWPEGRGLMLLRPMLDAGRAEVRDWLAARWATWIDDPANEDPKYARSRARMSLLPVGEGGAQRRMRGGWAERRSRPPTVEPSPFRARTTADAAVRSSPLPPGEGTFVLDRNSDAQLLAAALVCAGGGDRPPRGDRLAKLLTRLRSGETFTATLCGARIEASGDRALITREPGELTRRPPPPLPLAPGVEAVWDGRWAIATAEPGWSVVPAAGRMAALSDPDRAGLKALPPAARGGEPVLIRNAGGAPVLARTAARARSLVEQRLALTLDRMTHERDLGAVFHGETLRNPLFST
ncbi:MAG: tRNA lysidine(34) synthetase TilS [Brevundimonas sp.]|uniref:tRNA lysidine(34) synthetase TilS n=1 Tax=Brevundimonas sp. TaxID=1871086 RepID=UPI002489B68F|nr:tRNA lysidine(34) synthetase TilS [Brevundimonas sp.]MDI1328452.1 tRNA lysidine(34) synthetase TilS [Brevundimonas sp.]